MCFDSNVPSEQVKTSVYICNIIRLKLCSHTRSESVTVTEYYLSSLLVTPHLSCDIRRIAKIRKSNVWQRSDDRNRRCKHFLDSLLGWNNEDLPEPGTELSEFTNDVYNYSVILWGNYLVKWKNSLRVRPSEKLRQRNRKVFTYEQTWPVE